jgi:hypothetical protein
MWHLIRGKTPMRVVFVLGLALLLLAAAGAATLATRSVPRQGLQATLSSAELAIPGAIQAPATSAPTPGQGGGALLLWGLAALGVGLALVLARLALPQIASSPPAEVNLPLPASRWRQYALLLTIIGLALALVMTTLMSQRVTQVFSTINSGLNPGSEATDPPSLTDPLITEARADALLYAEPATGSERVGAVAAGEQLYALIRTPDGRWVGVETAGGLQGWVQTAALRLSLTDLARLATNEAAAGDDPDDIDQTSTAAAVAAPTIGASPGETAVRIRADWPGRLEVGQGDTVSVRLVLSGAPLPTTRPGQSSSQATPIPVGTPGRGLQSAFGSGYTACARASIDTPEGLSARLLTPSECLPLAGEAVEWTWRVDAAAERSYPARLRLDVFWVPVDGGSPLQSTVWAEGITLNAENPLVPSRQLGTLSLASAGLGLALTAPAAYRRTRAGSRPGEVEVELPIAAPAIPEPAVPIAPELPSPMPPRPAPEPAAPEPGAEPPTGREELPAPVVGRSSSAAPRRAAMAHLNTEFKGVGAEEPLRVGKPTSLFVWVGEQIASSPSRSSRPFAFDFDAAREPIHFVVRLDADPECWAIESVQPEMIVTPPGSTDQAAVFRVTALKPGRDKLYLSVERADSGAAVQHIWLTVTAAEQAEAREPAGGPMTLGPDAETGAAPAPRPAALAETRAVRLPLDAPDLQRREVRITVASGRDPETFTAVVDAELPSGHLHQIYTVPVSAAAVQNATLRLRSELERIVLLAVEDGGSKYYPFADPYTLTVEEPLARQAAVALADAGQQVWHLLFQSPRAPEGLKRAANALRDLPHGSELQIVIESQQFIVPWALLYDKPGEITAETLDWSGFWGYRLVLDVLPPGDYPEPTFGELPPMVGLLFNDDEGLRRFTEEQERFVRGGLGLERVSTARGAAEVRRALAQADDSMLLYVYCHGQHESGATRPGALASESALTFSRGDRVRLADMRRIVPGKLKGRPLVFLNACEGATQDAFYYDGFMPFFIEECGARGFIGTEVKAPQLLAHDYALRFLRLLGDGMPVGEILWRLRRHYLDQHHNLLAFNYTLYGPDEVQLARPLDPASTPKGEVTSSSEEPV